jgi:hypothetical protein
MQRHNGWPVCNMGFPLTVKTKNCHWQYPLFVPVSKLLHRLGHFDASASLYFNIDANDAGDVTAGATATRWLRVWPPVTSKIVRNNVLRLEPPSNSGARHCYPQH